MNILKRILALFICFLILSALNESYGQYNWSNLPIGGGGFVSGIITSKFQKGLMYARTDVGGAYRWDTLASKWIPLLDWVSENQTGYLGVESIAIDEAQPNNVYMLVGTSYFNSGKTAILKSNDYGNTFTETIVTTQFKAHGNGNGRQTGEKLVVDPKNSNILYCGTRLNGLWKSTDAGATWVQIWNGAPGTDLTNDNGVSFVVMDTSSVSGGITQRIFFGVSRKGTNTNLYVSNNAGSSFSAVSGGASSVTTIQPHRAVMAGDTTLYISYASDDGPSSATAAGAIWKYKITGNTWTNITPAGFTGVSFGGISVDPANSTRIIASSINQWQSQYMNGSSTAYGDRLFLSTNSGSTWTDLITKGTGMTMDPNGVSWILGNAIHWAGCIEFDPFNTAKAWVTSGNGLFSCDNIDASSTTWKFNVKGLEETVPLELVSIETGPVVSAIGDYDGFRHTDVTQYGSINSPRIGTTNSIDYAALNPNVVVRVGSSMYYSLDTAKTWTMCTITNGSQGNIAVAANGSIFLHAPQNSSTVYRSVDRGTSWTAISGLTVSNMKPIADPVNSNKFYAYNGNTGQMMISTDGGRNFASSGVVGSGGKAKIRTTPGKEGHLWVALNSGLSRSTNSGANFSSISGVSYCEAVGLGKGDPSSTYPAVYIWGTVSGVTGLYRSTDEGANWVRINDDDHEYGGTGNGEFVVGDMNEYGRVYMSTVGRGIIMVRKSGAELNQAPVVSITSPSNGSTYLAGNNLTITATASDPDGTVSFVEFYSGSLWLGVDSTAPYSFTWNNVPLGTHTITARATDDFGLLSVSGGITITDPVTPDCHGDAGGSAYVDSCSVCVEGNTGKSACVMDCYGDWGGTAYVDGCSQCVGGNTNLTACVKMEAELACGYNGSINTYGATFVNMKDSIGAAVMWSFQSTGSQSVTLNITYFNNGSSSRMVEVFVNGVSQIASVGFPAAGWNWATKSISLSLANGNNKVKVVLLSTGGFFALDKFSWSNAAVTAGSCVPVAQTISGLVNVTSGETGVAYSITATNPNSSYTWTIPPGATIVSGQGTSSIVVNFGSQGGTVRVTESNSFGSSASVANVIMASPTGIFSSTSNTNIVNPNPFTDEVNITFNSPLTINMTLKIIDMKGTVIYESNQHQTNKAIKLKEELGADGVYTVIGIYNNEMQIVKVVKQ
jgi:xyloglucan-specific exo-beta-1,4-glucanase